MTYCCAGCSEASRVRWKKILTAISIMLLTTALFVCLVIIQI